MVSYNHEAVMVKEVINNLILDKQGSYIDGTHENDNITVVTVMLMIMIMIV